MKNYFLRFWPFIFIVAVWIIFSYPYFLKGKAPFASTYQINNFAPWSAYEKFWGPVKNGAMPDVITQIYPWRHLTMEIWKSGQIPFWNPYSFSGNPLLANYQSAVFSPFNILFFIFPFRDSWSILVLLQPLLAGIFTYIFARSLKVSRVGSLISAASFMFCGFMTVWMGYATLGYAILFLPFSLFNIEKYYQTRKLRFLILLSISIPMSFFSGHFQISLYFFIFILAYIFYKFISTKNIFTAFYLLLFICFGLLLSMPQIMPSLEFYSQSFRSSFFQKGAIPLDYIPTFLAPDFFGNPVTRNDWFGYYAEWNAYIGIIPLMLAIYSVLNRKKGRTLFLFLSGIFVLMLAFNTPISKIITDFHLPILSTSATNRIVVIFSFSFAILAGIGFDKLIVDIKNTKTKTIISWVGLFGIFYLTLWLIIAQKFLIPADKIYIAKSNLILPTIIFAGSTAVISFSLFNKKLMLFTIYFLLFTVSFDMLRFATKWQAFDPKNLVFADTPTSNAFQKIDGFHRVLGNLGGEAAVYYHLPSAEGYDALYVKRYGEFIGFINNQELITSAWSVVNFSKNGLHTKDAINLLDIKYIVHKLADDHASWTFPFWIYPKDQFKLIYKDSKYEFYENTKVFPRAFLVGEYKIITNSKEILKTLFDKKFNLRKEIILEEDPKIKKSSDSIGFTDIIDYTPNKITINVNAQKEGLLFLTDPFYKGWRARVDGKDVRIYRANYAFRAIPISEGKHTVVFNYIPWSFRLGLYLGFAGLLGIGATFLISKISNRLK